MGEGESRLMSDKGLDMSELRGLGEPEVDAGAEREYVGLLCTRDRGAWVGLGEPG